jgi:mRNA interferase MazF
VPTVSPTNVHLPLGKIGNMADPIRGEIWLADLGAGRGHEQSGQRPVLVVSDDAFNAGLAGLVMTVPLTSKIAKLKHIPAHFRVNPPEAGLKIPSVILCDQLRTIIKDRLGKAPWGKVSASTLAEVEKALRMLLGL